MSRAIYEKNPRATWRHSFYVKAFDIVQSYLLTLTTSKAVLDQFAHLQTKHPNLAKPRVVGLPLSKRPAIYKLIISPEDYPSYMKRRRKSRSIAVLFVDSIPGNESSSAAVLYNVTGPPVLLMLKLKHFEGAPKKLTSSSVYASAFQHYSKLVMHESVHLLQALSKMKYGRGKSGVGIANDEMLAPYELKSYLESMIAEFVLLEISKKQDVANFVYKFTKQFKNTRFRQTLIKDFFRYVNKNGLVFK